ncbi:MAG: hypothetical protein WCF85_19160 [Rhodospirillaceae bacterium]
MTSTHALDSKAAFARRISVSAARISQLVSRGMPVTADGRVDVAVALAWLEDNLDTSKRTGAKSEPEPSATKRCDQAAASGPVRSAPVAPSGPGKSGGGGSNPGLGGPGGPSLAEAKRIHELVKVQRAKLALERERDELVSRQTVQIAVFSWARQERDSWLAWCRRVVPLIASETGANPGTLFAALDRHVREHLNDLVEPVLNIGE